MYRVLELQTNSENVTAMIDHGDKIDRNEAESKLHAVAQFAAISEIPIHTVVILNAEGEKIKKEVYKHEKKEKTKEGEE